jgi:hypothetical protein
MSVESLNFVIQMLLFSQYQYKLQTFNHKIKMATKKRENFLPIVCLFVIQKTDFYQAKKKACAVYRPSTDIWLIGTSLTKFNLNKIQKSFDYYD